MYLPKHFEEHDSAAVHALVHDHPLATWVVPGSDGLLVNPVPFLLDTTRGEHGTLIGHVARANPVWQAATQVDSVLVFNGPQAYVSPNWYPSKHAHGKAVPTWNYALVQAHGRARVIDDKAALLALVSRLTDAHEAGQAHPWRVSDAPAEYIDAMLGAIVGIEVPVQRWVAKFKTSQNRAAPDRDGVAAGLRQQASNNTLAMAALVQRETQA